MDRQQWPDPSAAEMGTIARAVRMIRFLDSLEPGQSFSTADAAVAVCMSWHAARYQLEMISLVEPLYQNGDSSWQYVPPSN